MLGSFLSIITGWRYCGRCWEPHRGGPRRVLTASSRNFAKTCCAGGAGGNVWSNAHQRRRERRALLCGNGDRRNSRCARRHVAWREVGGRPWGGRLGVGNSMCVVMMRCD
eukprot:2668444-Rhodomonas_salina.1